MSDKIVRKTFIVERKTIDAEAGIYEAMVSTESVDRDGDVLRADGVELDNYLRNPVVLFGHQYNSAEAVVGKALEVTAIPGKGIRARFQFAPADANPNAERVRRLWAGEFLNATSVGFIPKEARDLEASNGRRGLEFKRWEMLEFSIVPIPSNQDALRLALKALGGEADPQPDDPPVPGRAWVRRLVAETGAGRQTLYANFFQTTQKIPDDAQVLIWDFHLGECTEEPHPLVGQDVIWRHVVFVPPLEVSTAYGSDAITYRKLRDGSDEGLVAPVKELWEVIELGGVVDSIPLEKAWQPKAAALFGDVPLLTRRGAEAAERHAKRLAKRGRVLSAKNEATIREAQTDARSAADKLDGVLKQLDEQPEGEDGKSFSSLPVAKGAIASHTTPKADPDTEWDGPAVVASLPNEAAALKRVHAWMDEKGDPDAKQSYKFPHHLADGRVVLRGVNNAKARLPQASIPDEDRAGVEAHLNRHQAQFEEAEAQSDFARALREVADGIDAEHLSHLLGADGERDLAQSLTTLISTIQEVYAHE